MEIKCYMVRDNVFTDIDGVSELVEGKFVTVKETIEHIGGGYFIVEEINTGRTYRVNLDKLEW